MEHESITEMVTKTLKGITGVGEIMVLSDEELKQISILETKADSMTLMGLGIGDNKGVKEVLKCDTAMSFQTTNEYSWPSCPNIILTHEGKVVGEDMDDTEKLKELDQSGDALVIGNIALYDKSILMPKQSKSEPLVVVLPPKPCPQVEELPQVSRAILASPSPPTDEYIKERMDLDNEHGTGTFLLGLDFEDEVE